MDAEVPQMNEPRKTPLVTVTMAVKQDTVALFSPQDPWWLRLTVHAINALVSITVSIFIGAMIAAAVTKHLGMW